MKTYYQPIGVEKECLPSELWSFQVFADYEDAMNWLVQHGYDLDEWEIVEYHDDDIEEPRFINEYGDEEE